MASALTILFLGCWFAGWSGVSGEWSYPKPSISVSPGGVIPVRGNVTIRCRNQRLGMRFLFYKDGDENYPNYTDPAGSEAEFPITSARREHSGNYTCRYSNRTGEAAYSEPSDPVQIIVAELRYPKPNISLSPSGEVAPGGAVTIRCRGSHQNVRFRLYKDGNPNALQDAEPAGDLAEFLIRNVKRRDAGSYSCYYHHKSNRFIWSHPSDPVELVVAGGTNPTQPGKTLAPTCPGSTGPGTRAGSTKSPSTPTETGGTNLTQPGTTPASTHPSSPGPDTSTGGRNSPSMTTDTGRTDPTQPGTTPTSTRPGSARPGGSEPSAAPVLTRNIIAGVSAAAAGLLLLLLLLLAFVCYRRTRGRKGPTPRQSRESEAAATVYALMAEGKQMDVLPRETDPGAEGLTYAELDSQVLQAKRGDPAPAPEPVLYATINVSQGPDG